MKRKQWLSLLGLGLMFSLSKPHLLYANQSFGGGDGTERNPYRLSTPEHLTELQVAVDGGNTFSGKYFVLTDDIDFTGYDNDDNPDNGNFKPIGDKDSPFSGSLDGNHRAIINLNIQLLSKDNVGFFGEIENATIKKILFENTQISGGVNTGGITANLKGENELFELSLKGKVTGTYNVGGVVGFSMGKLNIQELNTTLNVVATGKSSSNDSNVGAFIGDGYSSDEINISNSSQKGNISGLHSNVGGLVGNVKNATIEHSYFEGNVSGKSSVGGIGGLVYTSHINCVNSSGVVEVVSDGGGLVGFAHSGEIINSYSLTRVVGTGDYNGGLIGNSLGTTIENTYSAGDVSGKVGIGGLIGSIENGKISNSYSLSQVTGKQGVGGLFGVVLSSNYENLYHLGNVTGTECVGGIVGNDISTQGNNVYHLGEISGNLAGLISGLREGTSNYQNIYFNQDENESLPYVGFDVGSKELDLTVLKKYPIEYMTQMNSRNYMTTLDFENIWTITSTTPMFKWQKDLTSAIEGDIQISGNLQPLMIDVTIPSIPLELVIDPNSPQGAISPEFEVRNNSNSPIKLELKTFEQTTSTFNDVLPDKYDSWEGLNKKQSQDLALGLVAKDGVGWQQLTTPTSYVANHTEHEIGIMKPTSSVSFEFDIHHGRAFSEAKTVQYRMVLVFDLLN